MRGGREVLQPEDHRAGPERGRATVLAAARLWRRFSAALPAGVPQSAYMPAAAAVAMPHAQYLLETLQVVMMSISANTCTSTAVPRTARHHLVPAWTC